MTIDINHVLDLLEEAGLYRDERIAQYLIGALYEVYYKAVTHNISLNGIYDFSTDEVMGIVEVYNRLYQELTNQGSVILFAEPGHSKDIIEKAVNYTQEGLHVNLVLNNLNNNEEQNYDEYRLIYLSDTLSSIESGNHIKDASELDAFYSTSKVEKLSPSTLKRTPRSIERSMTKLARKHSNRRLFK